VRQQEMAKVYNFKEYKDKKDQAQIEEEKHDQAELTELLINLLKSTDMDHEDD
jgi:RPA family protein